MSAQELLLSLISIAQSEGRPVEIYVDIDGSLTYRSGAFSEKIRSVTDFEKKVMRQFQQILED